MNSIDLSVPASSRLQALPVYLSLALLAVMCFFPFVYPPQREPLAGFYHEWLALLLGLWAFLVGLSSLFNAPLPLPRIALAPLLLLAVLGLQLLFLPQVYKEQIQLGMGYLLWAALLMILAYSLRRRLSLSKLAGILAAALVTGGIVLSLQEFMFRYAWGLTYKWGGLGQAELYADYLALSWMSVGYLWLNFRGGKRWLPVLLSIVLAFISAGLSLAEPMTVWLLLLPAAAFASLVAGERRRLLWPLAISLLLLALLQGFWLSPWAPVLPKIDPVRLLDQHVYLQLQGFGVRWHLWRQALAMFWQSPWLGQGLGQFDWAYFAAGQGFPGVTDRLDDAHNLLLQMLAEMGWPAVLILLVGLRFWLDGFCKTKPSLEKSWLSCLLLILAVHSLFDNPLWNAEFLGLAAVLLGLSEEKGYALRLPSVAKWGVWLSVCLLIFVCFSQRAAYKRLETMLYDLQAGLYSLNMAGLVTKMQQVAADAPALAPYVNLVFNGLIPVEQAVDPQTLTLSEAALHFKPGPYLAYKHALLLAVAGKHNEAAALLKLALAIYPDSAGELVQDIKGYSPALQKKAALLVEMINAKQGK